MKIIDNPVLGIGLLLCVGLAVLGLAFLTTTEGQHQAHVWVTSDECPHWYALPMQTDDDSDDSPFLDRTETKREPILAWTMQSNPAQSQPQESHPSSVRVTTQTRDVPRPPEFQPLVMAQRRGTVGDQPAPSNFAEKRDELLFRIVKLRLERGEYEKLMPVVLQMKNPEKAVEAMLDFAEESDEDNITQLLDAATAVTLQMGQPRPPIVMGMPGGMPPGQPIILWDGVMPHPSVGNGHPSQLPTW